LRSAPAARSQLGHNIYAVFVCPFAAATDDAFPIAPSDPFLLLAFTPWRTVAGPQKAQCRREPFRNPNGPQADPLKKVTNTLRFGP